MKKNMGLTDKIIRLVVAVVFVVLFLTNVVAGIWGVIMLIIAAMFVVTSFISFCPLYLPFGINTKNCCKKKE
jgi:hypothetical protein